MSRPIHPDDPDWEDALYSARRRDGSRRLRARRRPLAKLIDHLRITRWRWFAGGRVRGARHRDIHMVEVPHPARADLGAAADDGTLLVRELERPQCANLRSYVRHQFLVGIVIGWQTICADQPPVDGIHTAVLARIADMPKAATKTQLDQLQREAVNEVTRAIMRTGIVLTWAQVDRLGERTINWMSSRLHLKAIAESDSVTFVPRE